MAKDITPEIWRTWPIEPRPAIAAELALASHTATVESAPAGYPYSIGILDPNYPDPQPIPGVILANPVQRWGVSLSGAKLPDGRPVAKGMTVRFDGYGETGLHIVIIEGFLVWDRR